MKQPSLFPNDSQSIKEHHLKRLRELRDEFKELGRQRAERRRLLDNARKQESWEELKRACYTIKR